MSDRSPNKRHQQKTYNPPASGYNKPGKGAGGTAYKGLPVGLDDKMGVPTSLPDESLESAQRQAERNYDKIK
jgi:hypothetical protein